MDYTYPGIHIFVFVLSIANRFTDEEKSTIELISNKFGKEINNHLMILFTRLDDLEYENVQLKDYIEKSQSESLKNLFDLIGKNKYLGICNKWDKNSGEMIECRQLFFQIVNGIIQSNKSQNRSEFYTSDLFNNSFKHHEIEIKKKEREVAENEKRIRQLQHRLAIQNNQRRNGSNCTLS